MKTTWIGWSVLLSALLNMQYINASTLDERTKEKAVDVFILIKQIETLSTMCLISIEDKKPPLEDGIAFIEDKMGVDIHYFEQALSEVGTIASLDKQLNRYDCLYSNNQEVIDSLYKEYDRATFLLETSIAIDKEIITQKDWDDGYLDRLNTMIDELYSKSEIVAIGQLVTIDDVPNHVEEKIAFSTNKYWYKFDKGWKAPIEEYLRSRAFSYDDEALYSENIGTKILFFIDKFNNIEGWIDIKNEKDITDKLNEVEWLYKGNELHDK